VPSIDVQEISAADQWPFVGPYWPSGSFGCSDESAGAASGGVAAVAATAGGEAGRRTDTRVIATTKARASTARPAACAPSGKVPFAGSDVSASCLMLPGSVCGDCGARVGNRPEALPPGLSVRLGTETPATTPGVSDVVIPARAGDGRTVMDADASGSVRRFAALATAVRLTDEAAAAAVRGTGTWAWSCRCAEVASTAPRSHEDVPSLFPQPKLKLAVPLPAGAASSWIVTSGTLPPVAQAATAHWAAWPGCRLCCKGATSTHTLTGAVLALTMAAVKTTRPDALPAVATAAGLGVSVGVAVDVGVAVVGVGVGVAVVAVAVAVVAVGVGVGVGVVAVGVALVVVGDAVGLAEVLVADGLGDATVAWRGSHDSLLPATATAAAATVPAVAARMPCEAAVSRTLPVTRVTAVRRACANHIKRPRLY
jgi:hypothetical protein